MWDLLDRDRNQYPLHCKGVLNHRTIRESLDSFYWRIKKLEHRPVLQSYQRLSPGGSPLTAFPWLAEAHPHLENQGEPQRWSWLQTWHYPSLSSFRPFQKEARDRKSLPVLLPSSQEKKKKGVKLELTEEADYSIGSISKCTFCKLMNKMGIYSQEFSASLGHQEFSWVLTEKGLHSEK